MAADAGISSQVPSPLRGEGGPAKPGRVRGRKVSPAGVAKAKSLRRSQTDAEQRLWNFLRNRSVVGLKFVRQFPIDLFVVDFVCRDLMLVIEVDGSQHLEDSDYDQRRTAFLNARGYAVLRFWNDEVLRHLDGVHEMLTALVVGAELGPSPGWRYSPATLSPKGRGDLTGRTK